jgi:hypothetical protein
MLALLGYLRTDNQQSEVRLQSVTHAEWLKVGDANPVTYSAFTREDWLRFR